MLKATTVKRKEDLVKEQRREKEIEREREKKIYVLVSQWGRMLMMVWGGNRKNVCERGKKV